MVLTSPWKRQQIPLRTNGGWPVSLTPSETPLGHLTRKGNEYFVDRVVPSHIEPFFLQSTLVTLDLSCMGVRVLGPAEVDWETIASGCFLEKSHPGNSHFTHRV